jgi:hypothetical protein
MGHMRRKKTVTKFLNVDLDIRAKTGDLDDFLRSIEPSVVVLHRTEQEASMELLREFPSLEETTVNLVRLTETLPSQARDIWNRLEFRRLNVGIRAGCEPRSASFAISAETVELLAGAEFEILFTVYAPPAD